MFKKGDRVRFKAAYFNYKAGEQVTILQDESRSLKKDYGGTLVEFVTDAGKEYAAYSHRFELVREENTMDKFYIIWNPASLLPPTVKFNTKEAADKIAKGMAEKFGGQFFVLEAVGVAEKVSVSYKEIK